MVLPLSWWQWIKAAQILQICADMPAMALQISRNLAVRNCFFLAATSGRTSSAAAPATDQACTLAGQ